MAYKEDIKEFVYVFNYISKNIMKNLLLINKLNEIYKIFKMKEKNKVKLKFCNLN